MRLWIGELGQCVDASFSKLMRVRRGNVLSSNLYGRIRANSRLSGNPDLLLTFTNSKVMTNCAFHPCIRCVSRDAGKEVS
jgi:hypothetical protein